MALQKGQGEEIKSVGQEMAVIMLIRNYANAYQSFYDHIIFIGHLLAATFDFTTFSPGLFGGQHAFLQHGCFWYGY